MGDNGSFLKLCDALSQRKKKYYFGTKLYDLILDPWLKHIRIKLFHFYKRCVSVAVVKPPHFFRTEESSLTRKMNQLQRGRFANKEEKLRTTIDVLVCYKLGRVIMGASKIDQ